MSASAVLPSLPTAQALPISQPAEAGGGLWPPARLNASEAPHIGVPGTRRPSQAVLAKLSLSQPVGLKLAGASTTKPASPYHRIIVVDEFAKLLGLSVNPGDKVPEPHRVSRRPVGLSQTSLI